MERRVVVTGIGAVTPIGNNVEDFWKGIKNNQVGIAPITKFDTTDFKVKLNAEIKDFNAADFMDAKSAKRMDDFSKYAMVASMEAMKNSGLEITEENADRIGCIIGSGVGGSITHEDMVLRMNEKGPKRVSPLFVPMYIVNMAAGNICIHFGIHGKSLSVSTACASGTNAVGEAFRAIKYGEADAVLTGGTEASMAPCGVAGFVSLNALNFTDDPEKASIPFDLERNGFIIGEGAGMLVLEELEHAKKRNADILAEVVGYGSTTDAFHITLPREDGSGAAKAMVLAMKEADVKPKDISYINAHGTSTHANDLTETKAIKLAFGDYAAKVPISSTKSMIGHLLGAAGAVELITCVKSIQESYIHPTVGLKTPDPECDLDYVPGEGRNIEVNYAISNSLGFGGHNASVIIKKYVE